MKFKKLSKSQVLISVDRLTRFKPAEEKYLRVFSDIITSSLIEPKYKKNEILNMDYASMRDIAEDIFNSSIEPKNSDYTINSILKDYENSVFNNDDNVQTLLDNRLNYNSAIDYIKNDDIVNLNWLKHLKEISSSADLIKLREKHNLLYPIEKLVIAEGITEEILLPVFAHYAGYDFNGHGVKVTAAGGKNQVVKLYSQLSKELKIPIFVLLDKDAALNEKLIMTRLRPIDKVYLLNCGEFEDLLPKQLIIKTINNEFKNFVSTDERDFPDGISTVKLLEEFYKTRGFHDFKKYEFACRVKSKIQSQKDISDEIKNIIEEISGLPVIRDYE